MNVRQIVSEVIELGDDGSLKIDYTRPRSGSGVSTAIKKNDLGKPVLIKRVRAIPGRNRTLEMFFSSYKDGASTALYKALKSADTEEAQQFVNRSAAYAVAAFSAAGKSFDVIVPIPSSSGLPLKMANALASRLGIPVVTNAVSKNKSVTSIGIPQRAKAAVANFSAKDARQLNGNILLVDDVTTTGSSFIGTAYHLLGIEDVKSVTAYGIAVAN